MVLTCRPQRGIAEVQRPRPQVYWPVDALLLAERLLAVGARQHDGSTPSRPLPTRQSIQVVANATAVHESAGQAVEMVRETVSTGVYTPTQDRFVGTLLGGAIGDALGRPNEGSRSASFEDDHPRHVTDYRKWHGWTDGPIGRTLRAAL